MSGRTVVRDFRMFVGVVLTLTAFEARAAEPEQEALFSAATSDLQAGRTDEAISRLETLADRGLNDPAASFNRGLAYANRASSASRKPGDLGQAACAFAEARALNSDPGLAKQIAAAEGATQRELGRKLAARGGGGGLMEPPAPPFHQLLDLMSARAWAAVGALGALFCLVSFVLYLRRRGGSYVHASSLAGVVLFAVGVVAENRTVATQASEESACIVIENASILKEPSLASRGEPLREGAHIHVQRGATDESFALVRWGSLTGYVTTRSFRRLAHR